MSSRSSGGSFQRGDCATDCGVVGFGLNIDGMLAMKWFCLGRRMKAGESEQISVILVVSCDVAFLVGAAGLLWRYVAG